ncbi:hypothetical protein [Streptomyces sp. NPDC052693]|uniref:hypothetical protein n=1 Tax=Streptomyces sp. NPDC052693 TaxID=3155814 RepID=UPI003424F0C8
MLAESLIALAAAGAGAVVQAAGTDAWAALRQHLARWFGRGEEERERVVLERLDRTAAEISAASDGDPEWATRVTDRQQGGWQERIENHLETLPAAEREQAAAELRALIASAPADRPRYVQNNTVSHGGFLNAAQGGNVNYYGIGDPSGADPHHIEPHQRDEG